MKKYGWLMLVLVLACGLVVGCNNMNNTGRGALIGGGVGAGAGAIATAAGASPWWILGGAAIGAAGGALIGNAADERERANADSYRYQPPPSPYEERQRALQDHLAVCRYAHVNCPRCGAVFCNSTDCPACHWRP